MQSPRVCCRFIVVAWLVTVACNSAGGQDPTSSSDAMTSAGDEGDGDDDDVGDDDDSGDDDDPGDDDDSDDDDDAGDDDDDGPGDTGDATPSPHPACGEGPYGEPDFTATVDTLAQGFEFLEGPAWFHDDQSLFFSDLRFGLADELNVPPSTLYRYTEGDGVQVFLAPELVGSNGLAPGINGGLLACTHDMRVVSRFDRNSKTRETLVADYGGARFNSPNDLAQRVDGSIYFSDPRWQLGDRPPELDFNGVYWWQPGQPAVLVDDGLNNPNGIGLSPGGQWLYVADDDTGRVHRYPLADDGRPGERESFAEVDGADGLAIDCHGNVYAVRRDGVTAFDEDQTVIGELSVDGKPSNATFGGGERSTLYLTLPDRLVGVELGVRGLP